jgi:hypothetical protein
MKLKLLLLSSILLLSGCWFSPKIVVQTKMAYTKVTCPDYPAPTSVRMLEVKPRAIVDIDGLAWVGFTPNDYGNIGINFQEVIRYIKAQKGQTKYYRDCILDFNVEIERLQDLEQQPDE